MKKTFYILAAAVLAFTSCDSYLDKLPDDRAEVDNSDKVSSLLLSAYPSVVNYVVMETSSDNVTDNGRQYSTIDLMKETYLFKNITVVDTDSPNEVWDGYFRAIASANQAIAALEMIGVDESNQAQLSEAKLCRAFSMFMLANTFCMAYDPTKADQYLGLPFPTIPGQLITERGTLAELYAKIDQDIEDALPHVTDAYSVPKYHFNTKAAYAFAARFNLYYQKWQKAADYATVALGSDPASLMRDYPKMAQFGVEDINNRYVNASEPANFMLLAAHSLAGRCMGLYSYSERFRHNNNMTSYETYWAAAPWGQGSTSNTIYYANKMYGTNQLVYYPKVGEFFEYTDKVAGIGYVHIVSTAFTADETILVRAEANAMLEKYNECVNDLNIWVVSHCAEEKSGKTRPTLSVESLVSFWAPLDYAPRTPDGNRDRSIKKMLHPQGFVVENCEDSTKMSKQEALIQMTLHMRRLETLVEGHRFMDLKRYGIEFSHMVSGEDPVVFYAGDVRGAIQLPADVINAGMEANPRQEVYGPTLPEGDAEGGDPEGDPEGDGDE